MQARTNAEELKIVARLVSEKLNRAKGPVRFLIPLKGWSSLSVQGQSLYDPEADRAFIEELKETLRPEIVVRELDLPLNSPEFAIAVVEAFDELMQAEKAA